MRVELIENYLDNLIPNPKCELEFSKDYELLISIMLSAQTTDKRVNKVTSVLFKKNITIFYYIPFFQLNLEQID